METIKQASKGYRANRPVDQEGQFDSQIEQMIQGKGKKTMWKLLCC